MLSLEHVRKISLKQQQAVRLVNSKFPPIDLFDDVADQDEFEALYALQSLTNPRLQNAVGNLNLLPAEQIPYGISGCSFACAPFTHVNPDGSRFSNGDYGVLYLADELTTAIAEVSHHLQQTFQAIEDLKYDMIVMRCLRFSFNAELLNLTPFTDDDIYHPTDYTCAQLFGTKARQSGAQGLQYRSVRQAEATCWALFSPSQIVEVQQTSHYEFNYDSKSIYSVNKISAI